MTQTPSLLAQLTTASTDPWQPYDAQTAGNGHGHHHHPIVPEPSTYGLLFSAICIILIFAAKRYAARKLGVKGCGCGTCGGGMHSRANSHSHSHFHG